jgi:8-amino-7-oxononanoate synthase
MHAEPERVKQLASNAQLFCTLLRKQKINIGLTQETPVVPVIMGSSQDAIRLSLQLKQHNIIAHPIIYPAVEENKARLRFFISSAHSDAQLVETAEVLDALLRGYGNEIGRLS